MYYLTTTISGLDYYYNCLRSRLEGLKDNATHFDTYKDAAAARVAIDDIIPVRVEGGERIALPFNLALKELRKRSGMSQVQASEAIGVCTATLSWYENGHSMPDLDCICKLAKLYDLTIEELVKGFVPVGNNC